MFKLRSNLFIKRRTYDVLFPLPAHYPNHPSPRVLSEQKTFTSKWTPTQTAGPVDATGESYLCTSIIPALTQLQLSTFPSCTGFPSLRYMCWIFYVLLLLAPVQTNQPERMNTPVSRSASRRPWLELPNAVSTMANLCAYCQSGSNDYSWKAQRGKRTDVPCMCPVLDTCVGPKLEELVSCFRSVISFWYEGTKTLKALG